MSMDDRWTEVEELMLRRTTLGLSEQERERLETLLADAPDEDREWIDRMIGELDAELADPDLALPAGLRDTLMAAAGEAERAIGREGALGGGDAYTVEVDRSSQPVDDRSNAFGFDTTEESAPVLPIRRRRALDLAGWAAAAAIAVIWFGTSAEESAGPVVEPLAVVDPVERLLAVADASDAQRLEWTATEDPTAAGGVTGEIVWSDDAQQGFMRFAGLEANDPAEYQYQLWIFDAERDERFPVDGGVFDIPAGESEVLVPIDPRLPVGEATLFAVTVESPGGVVVSDRSRIAVVAQAAEAE